MAIPQRPTGAAAAASRRVRRSTLSWFSWSRMQTAIITTIIERRVIQGTSRPRWNRMRLLAARRLQHSSTQSRLKSPRTGLLRWQGPQTQCTSLLMARRPTTERWQGPQPQCTSLLMARRPTTWRWQGPQTQCLFFGFGFAQEACLCFGGAAIDRAEVCAVTRAEASCFDLVRAPVQ